MIYPLLRPVLYRLDPERAHSLTLSMLRLVGGVSPLRALVTAALAPRSSRPVSAFGLQFDNPVGLAAGYDKDGLGWRGLACLGFGHVEVGTVTPLPQPGNPPPRMFRLPLERSLINRLGFPSRGADFVEARLTERENRGVVLGVNIGKQKDTPLERAAEDYELLMDRFAPHSDYLTVNISSPNTPELRRLQQRDWLQPLLARLVQRRETLSAKLGRRTPLLVKLSPDMTQDELAQAVGTIVDAGIDGVIATNTTIDRDGVPSPLAEQAGGLSGAALTARSTATVRRIHELTGGRLPLIACGGVMGADDAREKLDAGACLVQIYTGLIYEGPGLVRRIVSGLQ